MRERIIDLLKDVDERKLRIAYFFILALIRKD